MARISIQDCLDRIPNRFAVVMLAARRMRQLQKGSDPLVECRNKEAVTALREIAAGNITPEMLLEPEPEPEPEPSLLPDIMEPDPGFRAPQFGLGD